MPLRVICDRCGALLYEGEELKAPYEIAETYDGKCPNCGKKLSHTPKKVEVKPTERTAYTSKTAHKYVRRKKGKVKL